MRELENWGIGELHLYIKNEAICLLNWPIELKKENWKEIREKAQEYKSVRNNITQYIT